MLLMDDAHDASLRREATIVIVRLLLGFAVFLGALALVSVIFHAELELSGRWFVERFGAPGIALGTFLADGVHFPLPPQFYLLAGVTGGFSRGVALASVITGSALGGLLAFAIGRRGADVQIVRDRIRVPRVLVEGLIARHGYWGLAIAGLLPVSYWLICSMAGVLRMPYRAYAVLALMRVPRLLLSYAIIVAAWGVSRP